MFGGSFDYAIEQLKNIVEAGSVTDGADGACSHFLKMMQKIWKSSKYI